jgi:Kdo2-lipid IVA lauroyltransferase/acyltransferase
MKNKIEYLLFLFLGLIVKIIGLKFSRRLSFILSFVFFYFIPIRKKTAIQNLTIAFKDFSKKKIKKIALGSYKSFVIALVEILYLPFMSRSDIEKAVLCSNKEIIKEKYNEKKGLILLSAHFGNWEYVAASVSSQVNIPFYVIVKSQRNPYVNDWLNKARTRWINKVVPLGISIRQIYRELKGKNIVAMVADQRGPIEGIRVDFFGRKVSVYTGPAILALKTDAPIVYGVAVRQPDYSYITELHEISRENLPYDYNEKIIELSQRHTSLLESYIRQYPEQWLWMHKRWKY